MIQIILQKTLKKQIIGVLWKLMQNSRLLNRDLSAVNLKITFLFTKGSGLTSIPMNIARNPFGKQYLEIVHEISTPFLTSKNENSDGTVHRKSMGPKQRCAFRKDRGDTFSDTEWINHIWMGSSKTRFQYCKNSGEALLHIRVIQGHTGGDVIALELMGHVAIPLKWKEFPSHRECSFTLKSILDAGPIVCGKESKEWRQTLFFSPMDPWEMRLKKNLMVTYQSREEFTFRASGNSLKTPSTGFSWPRHRKRDEILANKISRHYRS